MRSRWYWLSRGPVKDGDTTVSESAGVSATPDILLHICCAPCATYPVVKLREAGHQVLGFWHNPNIHPWSEHEARRRSLIDYGRLVDLPLVYHPGYDMAVFLRQVAGREQRPDRCAICYSLRLAAAASEAARRGIPLFTTTLLVSPHQDRDRAIAAGRAAGERFGVEFLAEDFRSGWNERSRLTRQYGLYRQQYCGCVFSEFERYAKRGIEAADALTYEDL